jgi:transcriptional regulator with XRE-family HTH domain
VAADTSDVNTDIEEALRASWGERIWRRRMDLGLSQTELADLCGVSQRLISHIEHGTIEPRLGMKIALARHLKVRRVGDLFPYPASLDAVRQRVAS